MPYRETPEQYIKQFKETIGEWKPREEAFKRWYKILSLYDELEDRGSRPEDKMESFVSNDPRVMYNMALFLLSPQVIPYNIPAEGYDAATQNVVANIEKQIREKWDVLNELSIRSSNGGTWLYYYNSLMLATGWYSVFAFADGDDFYADVWSPAESFPEFDQDGLASVLNAYTISASRARKKIAERGWDLKLSSNSPVEVYNYWCYDDDGHVHNCVIMANKKVVEESYPWLTTIPVVIGGVAGLPDRGILAQKSDVADWHETIGQSLMAPNETVFKAYNRLMSFMQQITRDTAQPRIQEKIKGGTKVVDSSNWNKRGAIYHLDVDEDISAVPMPGMPPEISLALQMMDGMKQRGGFDYSLFQGGQASGYAQALTSASAQQVLLPFKNARDYVINFVSNMWVACVRAGQARFQDFVIPREFPNNLVFKTDIKISVPGDVIQRATTARQINPNFQLSLAKTIEMTMPEVSNPNDEVVASRIDRAMLNPAFSTLDTIEALRQSAEALEAEGNTRQAQEYRDFADHIKQNLFAQVSNQQQPNPPGPPGQANAGQ